MADDKDPFMGPSGQPCTVYVEHAGAEKIAPGQEQTIEGAGGIVVKDPNRAAVVVVIKRGAESIEQRIIDTCDYRRTNPGTQGVVDFGWIYECIKQSKLLGPPDWGGHLLPPAQKCVITRGEADAAAFAIFGLCKHGPEHEEAMREPEAMQVDPVPVAGQSGSNPQNDTSEELSRGRRTRSSKNTESQKQNDSLEDAWVEVRKIIDDPEKAGWFRTFSRGDMLVLISELYEAEANPDPGRASGWWEAFTMRRAAETIEERRHTIDSWREFYRNRTVIINRCVDMLLSARSTSGRLRPLQDHSTARTSRYHSRSRSGGRTPNQGTMESDGETIWEYPTCEPPPTLPSTEPPVQRRKRGRPPKTPTNNQGGGMPQTPPQGKKTGIVVRPQRSSSRLKPTSEIQAPTVVPDPQLTVEVAPYNDQDAFDAMEFFVSCSDSELLNQKRTFPPRWKEAFDAFMEKRVAVDPAQLSGGEESTWRKWAQDNWDVISTGALALKGKAASNGNDVRKQLSSRNEGYTGADYDEVADYIGKQIQARKLPEGQEVAVMTQDFVWKAFVMVYLTDRNWKEWQDYYREKADDINRTARVRLKPEESLVSEVAAEMEQLLASGGYNSPPPNGVLKRSLEGSPDERRPKHPRL
ncbi:hypothetical protein FRC04_012079 [Tulasnella sp. 424]|nr:hypothetical protein FRC04_012079 [Tulasnella sp. 424]